MNVYVRRWGNSDAVRVPARVLAAAGIKTGDQVEVREEDGAILIKKAAAPQPITLEWLLENVAPDNLHEEVDFGPAVGREFR